MKKITTTLVLLGTLTLGLAADATIDAQIEKIQNAPAQERVQLMNEFKKQLMAMNQEQRDEAISKMQTKMQTRAKDGSEESSAEMVQTRTEKQAEVRAQTKAKDGSPESSAEMVQTRTETQAQAREKQMESNDQMNRMQNMNQHQAGNQYMKGDMSGSTGTSNFMGMK